MQTETSKTDLENGKPSDLSQNCKMPYLEFMKQKFNRIETNT